MEPIHALLTSMVAFEAGNPHQVQHSLKVYGFARMIAEGENLDARTRLILETAAIVHDVGIRVAREKYGRTDGPLQEREGPAPAREMLEQAGFDAELIDRVCYLVAHHHTTDQVDGIDYRILLEADLLVNLFEEGVSREAVLRGLETIFRTKTGTWLCRTMFGIGEAQ